MNSFIGFLLFVALIYQPVHNQLVNLTSLGITSTQGISYYSGFIQLANTSSLPVRNLHYLLIASSNSSNLPLTIFITNNILPGTSVLIDAFYNSGPFIIQNPSSGVQSAQLQYNPDSLVFQSNLLYIDVVTGVGYSNPQLIYNNDDQVENDAFLAIQQWLAMAQYQSFVGHGFHLMGTGYGGMIIPKVAQLLIANNTKNLQGILIGNPTFEYNMEYYNQTFQNMFQFLANHNFIDQTMMSAFTCCIQSGMEESFPQCTWLLEKFNINFGRGINLWDVYGTNCYNDNLLPQMYKCLPLAPLAALLTSNSTATALFVSPANLGWSSFFNYEVLSSYEMIYTNLTSLQILGTLMGTIKVWVYDADSSAYNCFVNTRYYLNQLALGDITTAQTPYPFIQDTLLDEQVAGYITSSLSKFIKSFLEYTGFVYATIKKGNYWAGQQQPKQYSAMFKNYLS